MSDEDRTKFRGKNAASLISEWQILRGKREVIAEYWTSRVSIRTTNQPINVFPGGEEINVPANFALLFLPNRLCSSTCHRLECRNGGQESWLRLSPWAPLALGACYISREFIVLNPYLLSI
ncbi:hypothetical protein M408DRAFT_327974 [Serendipita vermifera MAFF 305830]|uniref:Uncharacterized protein n=1 Tax=Serendipita vermifera MAFF 305830 TaxID=933852 RepID=A0A0C3BG33_SERVB|nr:hypothetical protein M408DRAFT_327974 [Serendipita vermifera MAFF 305830]